MNALKEMFKPNRKKILFTIAVTILHLILILTLPVFGFKDRSSSFTIAQLILSIIVNVVLVSVAYYLFFCSAFSVIKAIKKPIHKAILIFSIFILLISNPVSVYFLGKLFDNSSTQNIEQQKSVNCGQEILSFADYSKAKSSGLIVGDVVMSVDGTMIININDLITNSKKKQPGDITTLQTNRGEFKVEVVNNPATFSPALGIAFKDVICP
jgi:hypothetical protein